MRICIINNIELEKKIRQTDVGKVNSVSSIDIDNIKDENQLLILDYKDFIKNHHKFEDIPVLLYVNDKELREAIKYLRKGVIDIIPENADNEELNEILKNSIEALHLFKRKNIYSETEDLKNLLDNLMLTYSLQEGLEKAAIYIKEKTGLNRVFISVIKRGKEKIISGIGKDFKSLTNKYKKTLKFPWINILGKTRGILIEKQSSDIHPNGFIKVPLFIKDNLIGIITLDNYKESLNTDFDKELIMLTAMFISLHMENYRIYIETVKTKELLKEKEQKEILTKLINSLNHEINNPLTVAYLNLESIKRKIENPNGMSKNLDGLEISLERIKDIMDNVNKVNSGKFLMVMKKRDLFNFQYEA